MHDRFTYHAMTNSKVVSVVALLVAILAVGIPYWRIPYSQVSLPGSLYGVGLVVVILVAAVLRTSGHSFKRAFTTAGMAMPAAVVARVVFDGVRDPTSHNLWPFEVVIAAVVGFAAALAGALIGVLASTALRDRST